MILLFLKYTKKVTIQPCKVSEKRFTEPFPGCLATDMPASCHSQEYENIYERNFSMIIRQNIIQFPTYSIQPLEETPELCLFFDIETTGLSWKRSHLYLLGAIFFENGQWIKKLWFCQKPSEEAEVLKEFSLLLNSRKYLFHFNGTTFDVPYLMHKYTFYQLEQSWEHLVSKDLYQSALPFKKIWEMEQMKQKDLEKKFGIFREDPYTGGDLIQFYQNYLRTADEDLLNCLMLHNSEDMDGLVELLPILYVQEIFQGNLTTFFSEIQTKRSTDCVSFTLHLKCSVNISFHADTEYCQLNFTPTACTITIPVFHGVKKYFFPDYKNYYYLKYEDCAIHKSVGAYVDKEYRENAKAHNCYQKKEGDFLPQFDVLFTPMYKDNVKDNWGWFAFTEDLISRPDELNKYVSHLLACTLKLSKCQSRE